MFLNRATFNELFSATSGLSQPVDFLADLQHSTFFSFQQVLELIPGIVLTVVRRMWRIFLNER